MRRFWSGFASVAFILWGFCALAGEKYWSDKILDTLRFDELLQVLEAEAVASGAELDGAILNGAGQEAWLRTVARIHNADRWASILRRQFSQRFPDQYARSVIEFMGSQQGQHIVSVELETRLAFLDDRVEEASKTKLLDLVESQDPIISQIHRYIEINALIENNVAGGLNSNLAFFKALQNGAGKTVADNSGLLDEIWAQAPRMRTETEEWLLAFLAAAYSSLSSQELEAYLAFCETPEGQALNTSLFDILDAMMIETAAATGLAANQFLTAERL
ncbi:MAG: hypothetical protein ACPGNV_11335 [Mangrovicoccus sp.]